MHTIGFAVAALILAGAASASAQPALLSNGQVTVRPAETPLDRQFKALVTRTTEAAWIGYDVPMVAGERFLCDWDDRSNTRSVSTSVKLEPSATLYVFYRVENGTVSRVRMFSEGCAIDAGARPVHWLTGADPGQSVSLLGTLAADGTTRRVANGALAAIAMHADPTAVTATIGLARSGPTPHVRGQALFWLAQRAGDQAIGAITDALDRDPDTDVKKKAVFALSQLPNNEGVPRLIDVARRHSNAAVRKQAMFWLGQSRDPRALAFFEAILVK